jgi:rRNA maturation endonuclease Nob1
MKRELSAYILICARCAKYFETHQPTGKCPHCGVAFEIQHGRKS